MLLQRLETYKPDGVRPDTIRPGVGRCGYHPHATSMLKISLEVDVAGFEREVDTHMLKAFQLAAVEALNAAREAAADAVRRGMLTSFDRPKPFTLDGVDFFKASVRSDGGDPSILIYVKDRTASYIDVHIPGGTRRAGDPFTTRRSPIHRPGPGRTARPVRQPAAGLHPGDDAGAVRRVGRLEARPAHGVYPEAAGPAHGGPGPHRRGSEVRRADVRLLRAGDRGALDEFPQAFTDAFDIT